jgi:hypothetical protein
MVWPALLIVSGFAGFAAGAATARWWPLAAVAPVALLVWRGTELEGGISAWLAFLVSVTLAAGIAAGVLTRRGLRGRVEAPQ